MKRWIAGVVAVVVVGGLTSAGVVLYSRQHPFGDTSGLAASQNADATLRAAARLAALPGIKDGSLQWLPQKHLVTSSAGSAGSAALTGMRFDVSAGTFCISANNGHRITNASDGVEPGGC